MPYVGQSLKRKEDARLLRGRGSFAADIHRPGMLHAAVLRSSHAHARILRVDVARARAMSGVVDVLTYADFPGFSRPIPIRLSAVDSMASFLQRPLASDRVRYAGEPVAVVLAQSRYQAEDALESIDLEYEPLPAVVDARLAARPGAPLLFQEQGTNVVAEYTVACGDAERAFQDADVVVSTSFTIQRHTAAPLETRGLVAEWDPVRARLTMWGTTKVPFFNRAILAQFLELPEHALHFVQADVGGGFGVRGELYPEDYLLPVLTMRCGRPVQWLEDRQEHLRASNHSREQQHEAAIALRRDGTILGMRVHFWNDMGGYVRTHGATVPNNTAAYLPGPYRVPSYRADVTCVVTNKTPAGTYRGPGRFEANFVRERLVDMAARELDMDPAEVRRRNFIPPEAMPYQVGTATFGRAVAYDDGAYPPYFEHALEQFDYTSARRQQMAARAEGRYQGIGIGFQVEKTGLGPWERAKVSVDALGRVVVDTGITGVGQGVETAFAQICADALGVRYEDVDVRYGDTERLPDGVGTFGSRGTILGGTAVHRAAETLRGKVLAIAGRELEVDPSDLELEKGRVQVRGLPERGLSLARVAEIARVSGALGGEAEAGLEATEVFSVEKMTYAYGLHLAVVEVDPRTGAVEIQRYAAHYDVGRAVNPRLVAGQIVGGLAQGLGGTLLEELVYDGQGQLLSGTFADYLLPTAMEVPPVEMHVSERTPSRLNPLGVKGAGEGGAVIAGAALANAVADALAPLGVEITRLPLSHARLHDLVRSMAQRER
jgi:carbon-monoxide dehydrogenase large subunit